jgi:hypothetical protein
MAISHGASTAVHFSLSPYMAAVVARRAKAILNELGRKFPYALTEVRDADLSLQIPFGTTYAKTDPGRIPVITLNNAIDADQWDSDVRRMVTNGWSPPETDLRGGIEFTCVHEFGHVLESYAGLADYSKERASALKWLNYPTNEPDEISEYAGNSPGEMLADTFAEYYLSPHPRALSRSIAERLIAASKVGA